MGIVKAVQADITSLDVDAIVNAANEQLAHGGGVALAIARAGGPSVEAESAAWVEQNGPVTPGTAAVTTAGEMPAKRVIHVVGPRFRDGQDNEYLLGQAVVAALEAARDSGCRTLAMPAISAGIFGYPRADATRVIAATCREWIAANPDDLDEVVLVGYDAGSYGDFQFALDQA